MPLLLFLVCKQAGLTAGLSVIDPLIFLQYLYLSFSLLYLLPLRKDLLAVETFIINIFEKLNHCWCQRLGVLL